ASARARGLAGAKVAVRGRDGPRAQEAARSLGNGARGYACDVAEAAQVEQAVATIEQEFEQIDVLVNNAGTTRDNLLFRINEDDWNTVLDTNLKGAFLMTKHAARSEEHTSELQSRVDLVCRLLLEKKKKSNKRTQS